MLFRSFKRSPLALIIVALHAWVFLSGHKALQLPTTGPRQYIEVWNVAPTPSDQYAPAIKTTKQTELQMRKSARLAEYSPPAAARPINPAINIAGSAPPIAAPAVSPPAADPDDPFDTGRLSPKKENALSPVDIDRLRAQARDDEKNRIKTPLERLHEREHIVRTIESKVADGAASAARKDCQTAYGGAGVFAIVPLLYGTLTDDGCKWK